MNPFLQGEGAGIGYAGFAGVAAFDAADAVELFAALLEVGLDKFYVGGRHHQDHAYAHVEGMQQLVAIDFADFGEVFEDGRDGPGFEIDLGFHAAG